MGGGGLLPVEGHHPDRVESRRERLDARGVNSVAFETGARRTRPVCWP